MVILGIDPGLANTGWGIVRANGSRLTPLAYGCISTSAEEDLHKRLAHLHSQVVTVIQRYQPQEVSIESVYFGANTKSAIATAHARGAVMAALGQFDISLGEYTPMQIKKAVAGSGAAQKAQVQYMVKAILGFDHEPKPDHAADALAACICHARCKLLQLGDVSTRNTRAKRGAIRRQAWEEVVNKRSNGEAGR